MKDTKTIDLVQQIKGEITVEELRENYRYVDGKLTNKAGVEIGYPDPKKQGYVRIQIKGKKYYAHRLIWIWHNGYIPDGLVVDHRDNNRANNRIDNLRLLDPKANAENRRTHHKNNLAGFIGVSKTGNRYRARISVDGKDIHIGNFASPVEAHQKYLEHKKILHKGYAHE